MSFPKDSYYQETLSRFTQANETNKLVEFEECEFIDCNFTNIRFEKCKFLSCKFNNCVLSVINAIDSRILEVSFVNCKVMGFDWARPSQVRDLEFTDCMIDYSNFKTLKLPRIKLINSQAKEVNFAEADLTGGIFTGTNFDGSVFFKTDLSEADFRSAKNYNIDVRNSILRKAHFSSPEVLSLLNGLDIFID